MHQQLRHIRPVRLVFRLVCDQLHRSNDPVLRIDAGKHQPLASRDAFGNTAPESTGLVEAKREHKADGCPAVYAVFEDPGQRIKMDEDLFPGEGFDLQ